MPGYVARAVRQVRAPSPEEQKKILDVTGEHVDGLRDHLLYSFALGTGLREHELAALNVGDVWRDGKPLQRIDLKIFKGSNGGREKDADQRVYVTRMIVRKLPKFMSWKKRNGETLVAVAPLFCARRSGKRIAMRTIRHQFQLWQERAGISPPYPFHSLRHASFTNLYRQTKDIRLVQRQARHKNVTTTQIYAEVSDEDVARAVGLLLS